MTDLVRALRDFADALPVSVPMAAGAETARLRLVEAADMALKERGIA